jgi:hypothetical protein
VGLCGTPPRNPVSNSSSSVRGGDKVLRTQHFLLVWEGLTAPAGVIDSFPKQIFQCPNPHNLLQSQTFSLTIVTMESRISLSNQPGTTRFKTLIQRDSARNILIRIFSSEPIITLTLTKVIQRRWKPPHRWRFDCSECAGPSTRRYDEKPHAQEAYLKS